MRIIIIALWWSTTFFELGLHRWGAESNMAIPLFSFLHDQREVFEIIYVKQWDYLEIC